MSEKRKLIILKIVRLLLSACMSVMEALEQDKQIDKSVLDEEIPPQQ